MICVARSEGGRTLLLAGLLRPATLMAEHGIAVQDSAPLRSTSLILPASIPSGQAWQVLRPGAAGIRLPRASTLRLGAFLGDAPVAVALSED